MTAALALSAVSKVYRRPGGDTHALGPIDLRIEPGSFVSVVGPSGCGKSTLLRLVAGLEPASVGTIEREFGRLWRDEERYQQKPNKGCL